MAPDVGLFLPPLFLLSMSYSDGRFLLKDPLPPPPHEICVDVSMYLIVSEVLFFFNKKKASTANNTFHLHLQLVKSIKF